MRRRPLLKPIAFAAAMVLTIAAALWFFISANSLSLALVDARTGAVYLSVSVEVGTLFDVSFEHSVNKSLIVERYKIERDGLYLEECEFSSFGAGVATAVEEGQRLEATSDGRMRLAGIHRKLPDLTYRIGRVTDHELLIGGLRYSLTELCGQNTPVRFVLNKD